MLRYLHSRNDPSATKRGSVRNQMNVSRACFTVIIVGGAAVTTVSVGTLLGVPAEAPYQLGLSTVSLVIGAIAGLILHGKSM